MSAGIEIRDIQTGIEQAWHGLTNVVESISRENCGILYPMTTVPLYIKNGEDLIETENRQIISLDDNLPVGKAVSSTYTLIENTQVWDMVMESLSGTQNTIVSCGTVNDRSKGFITVKIMENFIAAGRNIEPYLNILWGHGGNISLIARSGTIVTVCQNTFNMNLGKKGKDFNLSVKHTKNAQNRIDNMAKAIDSYCGVVAEFESAMNSMDSQECSEDSARKVFHGVLTPDAFERNQEVSTRQKNTVDRLVQLFRGGAGNNGQTFADAFNAVTDFYTHESSMSRNNPDMMKQFISSEFGSGNAIKQTFFSVLTDEKILEDTIERGGKVLDVMALAN